MGSVIVASAQSVAKVFIIGSVGYLAVLCTFDFGLAKWNGDIEMGLCLRVQIVSHLTFVTYFSDPTKSPFLRREVVGTVARFTFHALTIPLIYSTIAVAVTIESIGNYWFVIMGAMAVMGMSYIVATLLRYVVGVPYNQDSTPFALLPPFRILWRCQF